MKISPCSAMDVFDFDEDDRVTHSLAAKFSSPAAAAADSLQCVAAGSSAVERAEVADVPSCGDAGSNTAPEKAGEKIVSANERDCDALGEKAASLGEDDDDDESRRSIIAEAERRCLELKASSGVKFQLSVDDSDSSVEESEPVDVTSDLEESMARSSSSSPASLIEESDDMLNGYEMDHCSGDAEMDDMGMAVVLYPDYATYRDSYYTEPQLIFSDTCIKIIGLMTHESKESFYFECGIEDVVNIESQLFPRIETVVLKVRVISNNASEDDDSPSGIEELKIIVVEPNWSEKYEEITSLHQRYSSIWNDVQDTCMLRGTDGNDSPTSGCYFPVFEESFEEVIYPKGDADAVSISRRDVDLLQPETFINDTIVDFYIKYLKNQIKPEERPKYHFFNSFFFRKLADMDKDPSSASDGTAAFQRVRKWTRKVDLFGKEFVFIPINFSLHWSLVVICHLGEVATFVDEELDKSHKVPCILHMDSIKGNHAGLKHLIQSYLWEEWKERKKETSEEVSSRFHNLRFVSLELPQQENSFDCGLFLLHYLECFLAEVPENFSPFHIEKPSNFLNSNWFPPTEASLKRALIQRLISQLLKKRSQEVPSPASSDDDPIPESNVIGVVGAQFLSSRFSPGPSCRQNDFSSSQTGQGIELTLFSSSSMRNSECVAGSDLVLKDLINPQASTGLLMEQCRSFNLKATDYHLGGPLPPLEEDPETGEQFMFGDTGFHQLQMTGITPQTGCMDFGMGISLQTEQGNINCSGEPSTCASDDSSDVAITVPFPVVQQFNPYQHEKTDKERIEWDEEGLASASQELPTQHQNFEFVNKEGFASVSHELPDLTTAAEAFQNHDMMQTGICNGFPAPFFPEDRDALESRDSAVADGETSIPDNVHMIEDDDDDKVGSNPPGQQPVSNGLGSGDNVPSVEDGLVDLNSHGLGQNPQIVEDSCVVGRESPVGVVCSVGSQNVVDPSVGLGSHGQQQTPVENVTGLSDNLQIFENSLVGVDSLEHKSVDNVLSGNSQAFEDLVTNLESPKRKLKDESCDDSPQTFEDALADLDEETGLEDRAKLAEGDSVVLNSPNHQRADSVIGSVGDMQIEDSLVAAGSSGQKCVDVQMKEDSSVALNSGEHKKEDNSNGSGDDTRIVEDFDSSRAPELLQQQPSKVGIDICNVEVIEDGSVAPDSPRQHLAKRRRLSQSPEEDHDTEN